MAKAKKKRAALRKFQESMGKMLGNGTISKQSKPMLFKKAK